MRESNGGECITKFQYRSISRVPSDVYERRVCDSDSSIGSILIEVDEWSIILC